VQHKRTQPDTLIRENSGPDQKSKVIFVEEGNVRPSTVMSKAVDRKVPKVNDAKDNKQAREHAGDG